MVTMTPTTEKPTLGYWKIRGLGSQIRYEMVYLGIDYDEHQYEQGDGPQYDRSQWLSVKDTLGLDFTNLPYLIDGEYRITEPNAIMKYIASKYGPELLGRDPAEEGYVEMISTQLAELKSAITAPCYTTGDRQGISNSLIEKIKPIVNYLGSKQFLMGDHVTYVDFILFEILDFGFWVTNGRLYDTHPIL